MNHFVVTVSVLSACLGSLQAQESNPKEEPLPKATATSETLNGAVAMEAESSDPNVATTNPLAKKPQKIIIGGAAVNLFDPDESSPASEDASHKIRGVQLLNPFAPLQKSSEIPRTWSGRRTFSKRIQNPKTVETTGIKVFFIQF